MPVELKELGIAHIPEDRHKRGLLLQLRSYGKFDPRRALSPACRCRPGFMNSAAIEKRVTEIIENFDVRPPNPELPAKSLSGGNQQKLIIGREFELRSETAARVAADTRRRIGAIEFIHRKLIELRDKGRAVLLVSAELEEVTALADRLLVIREGKIVGEVDPKNDVIRRDRPVDDGRVKCKLSSEDVEFKRLAPTVCRARRCCNGRVLSRQTGLRDPRIILPIRRFTRWSPAMVWRCISARPTRATDAVQRDVRRGSDPTLTFWSMTFTDCMMNCCQRRRDHRRPDQAASTTARKSR